MLSIKEKPEPNQYATFATREPIMSQITLVSPITDMKKKDDKSRICHAQHDGEAPPPPTELSQNDRNLITVAFVFLLPIITRQRDGWKEGRVSDARVVIKTNHIQHMSITFHLITLSDCKESLQRQETTIILSHFYEKQTS